MSKNITFGIIFLSTGILSLGISILYEITVLVYIGLTFILWGCLFLLFLPTNYVRRDLMDQLNASCLLTINQIVEDSNVQGIAVYIPIQKGIYLPHLPNIKKEFIYIPKKNVSLGEAVEQAFMRSPEGLRLTPIGLLLADIMEKKSKLEFRKMDQKTLIEMLPIIMTQELDLANTVNINFEGTQVHVKIKKPVCEDLCKEVNKTQKIYSHMGCPLCSSIACILTRVTNKPIIKESCSIRNGNMEILYNVLTS